MYKINVDAFLLFIETRSDRAVVEALRAEPHLERVSLERALRGDLERCPTPIAPSQRSRVRARRLALGRGLGLLEALKGDPTRLIDAARARWIEEGGHLEYLHLMLAFGRREDALELAFALLDRDHSPELAELERFLSETLELPEGYEPALRAYLAVPSREALEAVLRFAPAKLATLYVRHAVRFLLLSGACPALLLDLAGERALTPEMQGRIDDGEVPAAALARLASGLPRERAEWLGLAARSALALGDQLGTIRHLRFALRLDDETARPHLAFVRDVAAPEVLDLLDRAGLR